MSKIPCKICSCGLYHDLSVKFCTGCSADLSQKAAELVETDTIPSDKRGMIKENLKFYVQKCICQTLNFTLDEKTPVTSCRRCGGIRVAMVKPVEYKEEAPAPAPVAEEKTPEKTSGFGAIADNIRITMGDTDGTPCESDEEEPVGWGALLGEPESKSAPKPSNAVTSITLVCITNPSATFTAKGKEGEKHLFGRYSLLGEYMQHDTQIGSEHCYVYFANGNWYVTNKKASNGTFLNEELLADGTVYPLTDGALLKLGHRPDSFTFRVTIR